MLISHSSLLLFVTGAAVLLVIPGPAVTYVVSRSIGHGRTAGLVSVLGIVAGTLCHVLAATLGLSALLVSSARAFEFVKYLGAAYLVYLGARTLLRNETEWLTGADGERRLVRIFGQGMIVNFLNPKTALFFLAFLPQFVDPARGRATMQIFQLGVLFVLMSWFSDSVYALVAGTVAERIRVGARLGFFRNKIEIEDRREGTFSIRCDHARRTLPPDCREEVCAGAVTLPFKPVCIDNYMAPPSRLPRHLHCGSLIWPASQTVCFAALSYLILFQ